MSRSLHAGDENVPLSTMPSDLTTRPKLKIQQEAPASSDRVSRPGRPPISVPHSELRTARSLPLSPLATASPMLASQQSTATLSSSNYRSQSSLCDLPPDMLDRCGRYSGATTSTDIGESPLTLEQIFETELSEDERSIINDGPESGSTSSKSLRRTLTQDVRTVLSSQSSRIRYSRLGARVSSTQSAPAATTRTTRTATDIRGIASSANCTLTDTTSPSEGPRTFTTTPVDSQKVSIDLTAAERKSRSD